MAAGPGGALGPGFRLVSLCHARMGAPAFGVTPGEGELWLTLRTLVDADMAALLTKMRAPYEAKLSEKLAVTEGLQKGMKIMEQGRQSGVLRVTLEGSNPQLITRILNEVGALYVPRARCDFARRLNNEDAVCVGLCCLQSTNVAIELIAKNPNGVHACQA